MHPISCRDPGLAALGHLLAQALTRFGPGEAGAEGSVQHATFSLAGQRFMCIDSTQKHDFTFTPSMSLYVQCETEDEIDRLYATLAEGGQQFMPLGMYGFSAKFGWLSDRFGVSWQLNLPTEAVSRA
jgi:predicted 3-demethylubiquinone-9 3-methyltransferase (glyoxalase superfamily)